MRIFVTVSPRLFSAQNGAWRNVGRSRAKDTKGYNSIDVKSLTRNRGLCCNFDFHRSNVWRKMRKLRETRKYLDFLEIFIIKIPGDRFKKFKILFVKDTHINYYFIRLEISKTRITISFFFFSFLITKWNLY